MKIEVDAGGVALTAAKLIAKEARHAVANRGKLVMAARGARRRGLCVFGFKRIAADLSKQRPTVVAIVTPTPIGNAKDTRTDIEQHGRPPMRRQSS